MRGSATRGAAEPSVDWAARAELAGGADGGAESASAGATLGGGTTEFALLGTDGSRTTGNPGTTAPAVGCWEGAAPELSAGAERVRSHRAPPSAAAVPNPSTEAQSSTELGGLSGAAGRREIPAALVESARAGTTDGGGKGLFLIWLR